MASDTHQDFARALWLVEPLRGELREQSLVPPAPGEVLVRALYSGISRGTESLVWRAAVPESERERMRCPFQEGSFPYPVKYGYSSVGRVEAGPSELCGRLVHCLYPHQTSYVVPASAVVVVPPSIPPRRAVLTANMETALNAVWDAQVRIADRASVVGAGVVGSLVAALLRRIPAVDVELIDSRPERQQLAAALGVRFSAPQQASRERDVVFHTSGSGAGLATALSVCAEGTSVIELSWYGSEPVLLELGGAFHSRRLGLAASQVGSVSRQARARFDFSSRRALALSLLDDGAVDGLLDGESAFDERPHVMPELIRRDSGRLCHVVVYP